MKLCLIAPLPPPYGGVANWERIIEHEIKKDKEVELSIINIAANKRPLDGRTFLDRVFFSGYVMLRAYFKLWRQICVDCPDIVHMTTSGGMGFYRDLLLLKLLERKKIPSVYHVHFGRCVQYKEKNGRCWTQIKEAVSLATASIAIDKKTYALLKPYAKKIYEINNPINTCDFEKYETKSLGNIIIYIGWVIKAKGIEELINGFLDFNCENDGKYRLQIVGPGEKQYVEYLKKRTDSSITFLGEVSHDEAMELLGKSEVLILPSYTEGFPNVILEAMSMKKPIIATEVGAIPDMLSGGAGLIIRPKSAQEVKRSLVKLFETDLGPQMVKKAYIRVKERYDIKPTYEKYKTVWNDAINTMEL